MAIKGSLRNNIHECAIGDYIKLKYSAVENTIGKFLDAQDGDNELDVQRITSEDMTTQSKWYGNNSETYNYVNSINPNGTFYAVCIDIIGGLKVFYPDRILQRNISYNTVKSSGMLETHQYAIKTENFLGFAQIMSYEEIEKYLKVLKEVCTDYRYDLGVPALSHTLGGGGIVIL